MGFPIALIPLLGSLTGIGTIATVYLLTSINDHLPRGVSTPPISFLGCHYPEHTAYQVGFALTGTLLGMSLREWNRSLYPLLVERGHKKSTIVMKIGGILAVVGVVGQGLVTLEEDLLLHLENGQPLSAQSIWHQNLASVFFLGAAMHCYATVTSIALNQNRDNSDGSMPPIFSVVSQRIKWLCVLVSLLSWPIAEGIHPARTRRTRNFNVAGLAQYMAVGSYIVFFGSYCLDLYNHHQTKVAINNKAKPLSKAD